MTTTLKRLSAIGDVALDRAEELFDRKNYNMAHVQMGIVKLALECEDLLTQRKGEKVRKLVVERLESLKKFGYDGESDEVIKDVLHGAIITLLKDIEELTVQ